MGRCCDPLSYAPPKTLAAQPCSAASPPRIRLRDQIWMEISKGSQLLYKLSRKDRDSFPDERPVKGISSSESSRASDVAWFLIAFTSTALPACEMNYIE